MNVVMFRGFAGVQLEAEARGLPEDPHVLMLHDTGQSRAAWAEAAEALAAAGRHVISLDMRGHGTSEWPADGRYDFEALVADLRAVLAQLPARPVIVGSGIGAATALAALGAEAPQLATALVLADAPAATGPACDPRFAAAVPDLDAAAALVALPSLRIGDESLPTPRDCEMVADTRDPETFNAALLDFLERRAPRAAPVYREGSDPRTLRDALGCFATGVTVVTTRAADGSPVGLTANSFTSVSLDPPLLLVCIARASASAASFETCDGFAVNMLHIGQQPTSNRFARRDEDRFAATPWEEGISGVPLLSGALANFECARHAVHDGGDHIILVGRVIEARFEPRRDPLLYFRGKYRRLHFA